MPSPSVCCEHPPLERRLGELRTRMQQHLLDQRGSGDPGDDVAPVVVLYDRLLVGLPRQAGERIAHEAKQELSQRQRPRRSLDGRRIEGAAASGCGARTAVMALLRQRASAPLANVRTRSSPFKRCARASIFAQAKSLQPPLHAVSAGRKQHEGPQERRAPVGDLKLEPRHLDDAGDNGHAGAQGPREAADHHGPHAPSPEKFVALLRSASDGLFRGHIFWIFSW